MLFSMKLPRRPPAPPVGGVDSEAALEAEAEPGFGGTFFGIVGVSASRSMPSNVEGGTSPSNMHAEMARLDIAQNLSHQRSSATVKVTSAPGAAVLLHSVSTAIVE